MKKITNREKVILGLGIVVTIGVLAYFFLLPVLMGDQSKSKSDLKVKQEKLQSVEQLKAMEPMIAELETNMRNQLGYNQISFKRNSAESVIMKQLAQIANQSDIREIEQLDVRLDKSKKTQANLKGDQSTLKSTVDRLYMSQIATNKDNSTASKEAKAEAKANDSTNENPEGNDSSKKNEQVSDEESSTGGVTFPIIPKDIPEETKQALIKFVQTHDGQTMTSENVDEIVSSSGIKDKKESERIKKRLIMYSNRVRDKKNELFGLFNQLGILQNTKLVDKAGIFSAKIVFKSDISQLIKLLYNLQTSARWVKIEGIQITMADRQKSLLGVELSLTATALYD